MGRWGGDKGWLDTGPAWPPCQLQNDKQRKWKHCHKGKNERERDAGETNNSLSALKCQDRSTLFMDPCLK